MRYYTLTFTLQTIPGYPKDILKMSFKDIEIIHKLSILHPSNIHWISLVYPFMKLDALISDRISDGRDKGLIRNCNLH